MLLTKRKIILVGSLFAIIVAGVVVVVSNRGVSQDKKTTTVPTIATSSSPQSQSAASSTTTSYIGMKLYRNEQYGFEFWYPERWLMENKTSYAPRNQLYLSVNLPNDYTLTMDSFSVSIVNPNLAASFKQGESTSTIVVANSLGETYQSALEGVSSIVVDLPINKQRLLFIVQKQHETEFKDILATLKFLK